VLSLYTVFFLNKKQHTAHAQITSLDQLSALPSHLQASPAGRSVGASTRPNRSNSGSPEGASLDPLPSSSTITAHVAQTPTLPRRAPPVSHSLSDSAADYYTLPRQRISFDSERDPSTSPRPGEFLNVLTHIFAPSTYFWSELMLNSMTYS
jgi:hypothetical protein